MKVICIDNKATQHKGSIGNFLPKEGKTYTVIEKVFWYGLHWYILAEDKGGNGWNPVYFIPIDKSKFDTQLKSLLKVPAINKKQLTNG